MLLKGPAHQTAQLQRARLLQDAAQPPTTTAVAAAVVTATTTATTSTVTTATHTMGLHTLTPTASSVAASPASCMQRGV